MSFEKNIGKQLNFQKELDKASKPKKPEIKAIPRGEKDDAWEDLGPNYQEQKEKEEERKKREIKEEKERRRMYRENDRIKRENFDNQY